MSRILLIIFITIIALTPSISNAMLPVIDVTAIAQLVQEVSDLEQETSLIKQELQTMSSYQWGNAQTLINSLGGIVQQSNGIAYSAQNADSQFKQTFPGYTPPTNYSQQYQQIVNSTTDTLNGVLNSLGSNAADFQNENTRLSSLQNAVQSAQGQTQAIQAASQIASEQVTQLQLLRQTLIAQTNAQTVYYASQTQKDAFTQAQLNNVISAGSKNVTPYGQSGNQLNPPQ